MRSQSTKILVAITVLFLAVLACNRPEQSFSTSTPLPPSELTLISLIETVTAQAAPVSTATPNLYISSTDVSYAIPTATPFVPPTDTPLVPPTDQPSIPPTDIVPAAPAVPQVAVSTETNCRTGPSQNYKYVSQAEVGRTYTLVGKYSAANYWIILLADGRQCWLWGQYATVTGDISRLPEFTPPAVGRIEGQLRNSPLANAAGIDHANVDIGLGFPPYTTQSDGKFVFEDVPAGEVTVTVTHSTYIVGSFKVFVYAGQVSPVVKIGVIPIIITLPARPTPTPIPAPCSRLLPNCVFLPTLRVLEPAPFLGTPLPTAFP